MATNVPQIRFDPFFDGDDGDPNQPSGYVQQQVASSPLPNGYRDAHTEILSNGLPATGVMRPGVHGLHGTIIPKATIGGIPRGTQPHSMQDVEITVDPHIQGQSAKVRLRDLNTQSIQQATHIAEQITPEPVDIKTIRLRGAAVMHTLASQGSRSPQVQAAPTPQPNYPEPPQIQEAEPMNVGMMPIGPPQQPPQQPPRNRTISPLTAFNQSAPPRSPQPQAREISFAPDAPLPPAPIQAPTVRVVFERQYFGTIEALYEDVTIEDGFMVLVVDTRYQGGTKYFPAPMEDDVPPMAINIVGRQEVYLVKPSGIQFVFNSHEFCVLIIEDTGVLQ